MYFRGRTIRNEPAYRPRPDTLKDLVAFGVGNFTAYVPETILKALIRESQQTAPAECYGHLLGRAFRDSDGYYSIVTTSLIAKKAERSPNFVKTTLKDEMDAQAALENDYLTLEKSGWFHSHPNPSSSYSVTDNENQRFICAKPWQLGLLVSIHESHASVFAFCGPEGIRCPRPYLMSFHRSPQNGHLPKFTQKTQPDEPGGNSGDQRALAVVKEQGPSQTVLAAAGLLALIGVLMGALVGAFLLARLAATARSNGGVEMHLEKLAHDVKAISERVSEMEAVNGTDRIAVPAPNPERPSSLKAQVGPMEAVVGRDRKSLRTAAEGGEPGGYEAKTNLGDINNGSSDNNGDE